MDTKQTRKQHWLLAAFLGVALGGSTFVTYWAWYFSAIFSAGVDPETFAVSIVSPWQALDGAIIAAVFLSAACVGACWIVAARSRAMAPGLIVAAGPAIAFLAQCAIVLYTTVIELTPGDEYLGAHPAMLTAAALMTLVPAVSGVIAARVASD